MRYNFKREIGFLFTLATLTLAGAAFANDTAPTDLSGELDQEINSFQVQLRPVNSKRPSPRRTVISAPTPVAKSNTFQVADNNTTQDNTMVYQRSAIRTQQGKPGFIQRFSAIPQMAFSIFDGTDANNLIPQNTTDAMRTGMSGNISTDLNLLGSDQLVLEAGISYLQFGSATGQVQYNTSLGQFGTYFDSLTANYIGASINGKWLLSGENSSSLYIKGGVIPMYMLNYNYNNRGNNNLSNYRYGNVNSFDLVMDFGIGYSFKISNQFHVLADITGYQGLFPIITNYNVYNAAITTGLGVAYTL